jgi:hypothetical protein
MTSRPLSRRIVLSAALGAVALHLPLAASAGFNFFTSEYTASRDELQAQVARRFPVRQRYAELFTVALREPRLSLDATANRAAIAALVTISSPLLNPQSVEGSIAISSALKYDPAAFAVRLDRPKAERLQLQNMTGGDAERLQQIGAVVAQELLRDYALIVFKPEQLTVGRKTYQIGQITVEADDIRVELQ